MSARAYELMVIVDGDEDDAMVDSVVERVSTWYSAGGGTISSVDKWGKRAFAYEINHKTHGHYVVLELTGEPRDLTDMEHMLRVADEVVRHKVIRLPEHEALRRELVTPEGAAAPPKPPKPKSEKPAEEAAPEDEAPAEKPAEAPSAEAETVTAPSDTEPEASSEAPAASPEPESNDDAAPEPDASDAD